MTADTVRSRDLLAQLLGGEIDRRERSFPLVGEQASHWLLEQRFPGNSVGQFGAILRLSSSVAPAQIEIALQQAWERHPFLQMVLEPGATVRQRIERQSLPKLMTLPSAASEDEARAVIQQEVDRPISLVGGPLWRACLLPFGREETWLVLVFHRVSIDRRSAVRIGEELLGALLQGGPGSQDTVPSVEELIRSLLATEEEAVRQSHWERVLRRPLPPIDLPGARKNAARSDFTCETMRVVLDEALSEKVLRFAHQSSSKPVDVVSSALFLALSRLSSESDLVVGFNARSLQRDEVGPFTNVVPVRTALESDRNFPALHRQLLGGRHDATGRNNLPLTRIRTLVERRSGTLDGINGGGFELGLSVEEHPEGPLELVEASRSFFDLELQIRVDARSIQLDWRYAAERLEHSGVALLAECLVSLLADGLDRPSLVADELRLVSPTRERELVSRGAGPSRDFDVERTVCGLIATQAHRTPDRIAVAFEDCALSYRELDEQVMRLASRLRGEGVRSGEFVGVFLSPSCEQVVTILAIQRAGAAYLPLDPSFPPDRIAFMVEDSQTRLVVTSRADRDCLPADVAALLVDELAPHDDAGAWDEPRPDDVCYLLYTSGSTGKPKGVEVTHRSVVNFLSSMKERLAFSQEDLLLSVTTLSFDIAGLELFLPLTCGARVRLMPKAAVRDGVALRTAIQRHGVTALQATPSTWRLLIDVGLRREDGLRIALCGGEAFPAEFADQLAPEVESLFNMYGPTEATIWATMQRVEPGARSVSLGDALDNVAVFVLDDRLRPVPFGTTGELYISGDCLAKGYWNRPDLTSERFVTASLGDARLRLYRTGDLARWTFDGRLEFLGRRDGQVKVNGHRIELGEIESVLAQHPAVKESIVLVRDSPTGPTLVAYLVTRVIGRRDPRVPIDCPCELLAGQRSWTGTLRDVAARGLGLRLNFASSPDRLVPDESVEIRFSTAVPSVTFTLRGRVAWIAGEELGIELMLVDEDAARMRQLVRNEARRSRFSSADSRQNQFRVPCESPAELEVEGEQVAVVLRDVGPRGAGLRGSLRPIPPESTLRLSLLIKTTPFSFDVRLAWVRGDGFGVQFEQPPSAEFLAALIDLSTTQGLTVTGIRSLLAAKLPPYMLPAEFVLIDSLPLLPNGKVDRKLLTSAGDRLTDLDSAFVPPSNAVGVQIAELWSQVLGVAAVGGNDDFFELGGHSLLMTRIAAGVSEAFGVEIPIREFFGVATVEEMSELVLRNMVEGLDPTELEKMIEEVEGLSGEELTENLQKS